MLEKIRLLGVMEMTFRRDANDRQLTFKDIAAETGLNVDDVELLVRKVTFDEYFLSCCNLKKMSMKLWVRPVTPITC